MAILNNRNTHHTHDSSVRYVYLCVFMYICMCVNPNYLLHFFFHSTESICVQCIRIYFGTTFLFVLTSMWIRQSTPFILKTLQFNTLTNATAEDIFCFSEREKKWPNIRKRNWNFSQWTTNEPLLFSHTKSTHTKFHYRLWRWNNCE